MGISIDALATGGGYDAYGVGSTSPGAGTTISKGDGSSSLYGFGKDDFFKLFLAQLQNQDPTNPMDDSQMISQLAQFSMIETLQQVSAALGGSQLSQASGLIGRHVTGVDVSGNAVDGVVDSVHQSGTSLLLVVGSQYLKPESVAQVTAAASDATGTAGAVPDQATPAT
jgi:flagellar basal-body rod modification protein FlgD